jgi:hypothetical protein
MVTLTVTVRLLRVTRPVQAQNLRLLLLRDAVADVDTGVIHPQQLGVLCDRRDVAHQGGSHGGQSELLSSTRALSTVESSARDRRPDVLACHVSALHLATTIPNWLTIAQRSALRAPITANTLGADHD